MEIRRGPAWQGIAYPLGLFAAVRIAFLGLAWFATMFAVRFGRLPWVPAHFVAPWPSLGLLAHGDVAAYARVAERGYARPEDALCMPLLPLLGRLALRLHLPIELALGAVGALVHAAAFVAVYRVARRLVGAGADTWSLGLLAAFPFAFHLADGGPLPWVVLATAEATVAAFDGAMGVAAVVVIAGALVHPAALSAIVALFALRDRSLLTPGMRWALPLAPLFVPITWLALMAAGWLPVPGISLLNDRISSFAAGPWRWGLLATAAVAFGGLALLLARSGLRWLGLASLLTAALFALVSGPAAAVRALPAAWGTFVALGWLAQGHQAAAGGLVVLLGMHQGLYLFLHVHHVAP